MLASIKDWQPAGTMLALFLVFVVGYGTGRAFKEPEVKEKIVDRIEFREVYLPKEEYDQRELQEHEERTVKLQSQLEQLREERRQSAAERKLLHEAEMDFDKLLETGFGKVVEEEIEKEIEKRIADRQAKPKPQ